MKKSLIYIVAFIAAVITMSSCREDEKEFVDPSSEDAMNYTLPSEQFQSIWNSMLTNYVMWDIDETDWQEVYDTIYPKFKELDNQYNKEKYVDDSDLMKLYGAAFSKILDHHLTLKVTNLWSGKNGNISVSPGDWEVGSRSYYHYAFYDVKSYLKEKVSEGVVSDYYRNVSLTSGLPITVVSALIDGKIPYLYFSEFNLVSAVGRNEALDNFRSNVLNLDIDGVIIDVRGNGGGNDEDEKYLLGMLFDHDIQIGYTRYKAGFGIYDYTPWAPLILKTADEHRNNFTKPFVVLVDVNSCSMAEITALIAKNEPNGCVIGERTYGATGSMNPDVQYYGGSFGNSNGNHYCMMVDHLTKTNDGEIIEGVGVTPDIEMTYDEDEVCLGNDTWIDRAVTYIKTGK